MDNWPDNTLASLTVSNAVELGVLKARVARLETRMDETPEQTTKERLKLHSLDYWQIALGAICMWAALGFKEPPEWIKAALIARLSGS